MQSFLLLELPGLDTRVELLLYPQSPTGIRSVAARDMHDVVEIYPVSSKFFRSCSPIRIRTVMAK
jgi:hypothetical protein